MPALPLSPDTQRVVERLFAPADHAEVTALLEEKVGTGVPLMKDATPQSMERIRFAVLKLSGGQFPALHRAIEVVNEDWRDTLVAAGFGHSVTQHERWFVEVTGG